MAQLNFEAIKKELEATPWTRDEDCDGVETRRVYLGHVFNLTPSGKVYAAWAPGTATEAEIRADDEWYQGADEHLTEFDAFLETGDGDPCDLFAVQVRDAKEKT